MTYDTIASEESIEKTIVALKEHGITAYVVESSEAAQMKVQELIPEGSEVMTMTSVTLKETGIADLIDASGKYDSVRNKLNAMDSATQGREMRKLGAGPDYAIGSVHAISETGEVLVASNTGSQLPAYIYGAGKVVWVVGAQKITESLEEANKRVVEYVLPLESQRAHEAYGVPASAINKLVTFYGESNPDRISMVIVKEKLGF